MKLQCADTIGLLLIIFTWSGTTLAAVPLPTSFHHGAVAADHLLASEAGLELLRAGDNAVDADCAAAFTLGVVSPASLGIGGGGFLLLWRNGALPVFLDFRESTPPAATRDLWGSFTADGSVSRRGGGINANEMPCNYDNDRSGAGLITCRQPWSTAVFVGW